MPCHKNIVEIKAGVHQLVGSQNTLRLEKIHSEMILKKLMIPTAQDRHVRMLEISEDQFQYLAAAARRQIQIVNGKDNERLQVVLLSACITL